MSTFSVVAGDWPVTQPYGATDFEGEPAGHESAHWHEGVDLARWLATGARLAPEPDPETAQAPARDDWLAGVRWGSFAGTVAADVANVRSGAGQDFDVIYQLPGGTALTLDGHVHRGGD